MSHTIKQKTKLQSRVRRLQGQLEAVERALKAERPCAEVLNLVASIRGAIMGLTAELIEDHIREHVIAAPDARTRSGGADDLIDVIRTYLK